MGVVDGRLEKRHAGIQGFVGGSCCSVIQGYLVTSWG